MINNLNNNFKNKTKMNMQPTPRNVKNLSNYAMKPMSFEEAVRVFLYHIKNICNYSQKTILSYESDFNQIAIFLKSIGCDDVREISPNVIADYIIYKREKGLNPRSVNRHLAAARSLFDFLCRFKGLEVNPAHAIKNLKTAKVLPLFITEEKMDLLIDNFLPGDSFKQMRTRIAILVFYHTGMRCQELADLSDEKIDFNSSTLKVVGKGNKERFIPFGEELAGEMRKYMILRDVCVSQEKRDRVFMVTDKGERMTSAQIRIMVKIPMMKVLPKIYCHPHVLRHTFATALMNHGASIEAIKLLLGHESVETTAMYEHVSSAKLKSVYNIAFDRK